MDFSDPMDVYQNAYELALVLTHNHTDSEDLASETLIKWMRHKDDVRLPYGWLSRAVRTSYIDMVRKQSRRIETKFEDISWLTLDQPSTLDTMINQEDKEIMFDKLYEISPLGALYIYQRGQGMTNQEIAQRRGVTPGSVAVRICDTKKQYLIQEAA